MVDKGLWPQGTDRPYLLRSSVACCGNGCKTSDISEVPSSTGVLIAFAPVPTRKRATKTSEVLGGNFYTRARRITATQSAAGTGARCWPVARDVRMQTDGKQPRPKYSETYSNT